MQQTPASGSALERRLSKLLPKLTRELCKLFLKHCDPLLQCRVLCLQLIVHRNNTLIGLVNLPRYRCVLLLLSGDGLPNTHIVGGGM